MTAAMGTLVFLATLWLLVIVGAAVLEEAADRLFMFLVGDGGDEAVELEVGKAARGDLG